MSLGWNALGRVGDGTIMSATYNFTTLPAVGSTDVLNIAVTADLGECCARTFARLIAS